MPPAAGASAPWRAAVRRLFRAAKENDSQPYLKSLFPLANPNDIPLSSPKAAPLYEIARHSVRQGMVAAAQATSRTGPGGGGLRHRPWVEAPLLAQMIDSAQWLEHNISRLDIYTHKAGREFYSGAKTSNGSSKPDTCYEHPNHGWYSRRLEAVTISVTSHADEDGFGTSGGGGGGGGVGVGTSGVGGSACDAFDVLQEMLAAKCLPTKPMYIRAMTFLTQCGRLDRALQVFWLMERYSPHRGTTDVASVLVSGALQAANIDIDTPSVETHYESHEARAAWLAERHRETSWRALSMYEAFDDATVRPDHAVVNKLLAKCASLVRSPKDLSRVLAALERAEKAGSTVHERTFFSLLDACDRVGDMERAWDCIKAQKRAGGSPSADSLQSLLEWAVEANRVDMVEALEAELVKTGKAQYLAALSSPRC